MSPEQKAKFDKDALIHKLQDELDSLEEQLYLWEEVPAEDLWEDGEIKHKDEVFDKINYHLFVEGDWKLMRRKA